MRSTARPGAAALFALACLLPWLSSTGCSPSREGSSADSPAAAPARSLLLVTLDTTRADHLSPYGDREAETPTLAALAAEGVVFEHAWAATPVTLPSHATLMTGLDPPGHGVRNNGIHFLGPELTTLAERLREAGFTTAAFVSAAVLDHRYGLDQGFETYDDDLSRGSPKELRMIAERPAEVTVAAARSWLDAVPAGSRFFLWVHLFDPHIPYEPPARWAERFTGRPYDGEIAYMDSELGRLLAHPRLAAAEGTLVMAVGDHGESLGEHGEASHAMLIYDATLRVPWILRHPGGPRGLRLEAPAAQVDVVPTALELLGLSAEPPAGSGTSMASAILGGAPPPAEARGLYAETFVPFYTYGWARLRSLREGRWKLIAAPAPELYDLERDPGELDNRFGAEPERAAELARRLAERVGEDGAPAPELPLDRETQEKLRSLGYLASAAPAREAPDTERPDPKGMIELHRAMERAEAHLYARDFETAERELRQVLARDRTNLAALADLARALGEQGRWSDAVEAIRRALALAPGQAELHVTLAGLETARGGFAAALEALDAALALDPRSLDARVEKARVLYRLGRSSEAAELVEAVLAEDPHHARALALWAERQAIPRGELAAAEAALTAAAEREPFTAEVWRALGRVREADGRSEAAEDAYRQGLEHQPRDAGLNALLGILLAQRGDGEAERRLRQALELSPEPLPEVHDGLAAVAAGRGDWPAMETQARRAVELDPTLASGWNHLAVALEETGRTAEALEAYAQALEASPGYWQARFNQGLLLRRMGRYEAAEAAFLAVLERRPGHAGSHYELGVLYGGPLERPEDSRRHLTAALEATRDPDQAAQIRRLLGALGPGG